MSTITPTSLRRLRVSLKGHALTTAQKAAVLIVLDLCADELERLTALLRAAQPLAAIESPAGLQWALEVRATLAAEAMNDADDEVAAGEHATSTPAAERAP